jgi:hypothetical protein
MTQFYITHTDKYGERHQLTGAWEASSPEAALTPDARGKRRRGRRPLDRLPPSHRPQISSDCSPSAPRSAPTAIRAKDPSHDQDDQRTAPRAISGDARTLRADAKCCGRTAARHRLRGRRLVQAGDVPEFKPGAHVGDRTADLQDEGEEGDEMKTLAILLLMTTAAIAQNKPSGTSSIMSSVPFHSCLEQTFVDNKPKCLLMSTNSECQVILSMGQAENIYESPTEATEALDALAQRLVPNMTPDNRARIGYALIQVINGGGNDRHFGPSAAGQRWIQGGGYDWYSVMGNGGGILFIARAKAPECRDKRNEEVQAIIDEAAKQATAAADEDAATSKSLRDAPTVVLPNGAK